MGEITEILDRVDQGDPNALDEVFERLHGELLALARSRVGVTRETLSATALVNELYLKLVRSERLSLANKGHFFACAATAMRQIMVDNARASLAGKRGGPDAIRVTLTEPGISDHETQIVALGDALDELNNLDSDLRELVELRFFAGMPMEDIAEVKARSVRSLHRDWKRARAFLHAQLSQ